jgi:hypothetical protein
LVFNPGNLHMRGGIVPPALLFLALGLALAFTPRRALVPSLLALLVTLVASALVRVPQTWLEGVFFVCWTSVIVTAASVHLDRGLKEPAAIALSINTAFWASAVVSLSGTRLDLLKALPCVLTCFPARWGVAKYTSIPVKVVSSWVIAVAILAATLQLLPVTPGYLPDHTE